MMNRKSELAIRAARFVRDLIIATAILAGIMCIYSVAGVMDDRHMVETGGHHHEGVCSH